MPISYMYCDFAVENAFTQGYSRGNSYCTYLSTLNTDLITTLLSSHIKVLDTHACSSKEFPKLP